MDESRILVVEDHVHLLEGIQAVLEEEGYTVLTASDGAQALELLTQVRPHLILADIMMPQMDGYALYKAVRQRLEWAAIPFIFLTAKATRDDVLRGKALGAEDYITKPFEPEELLVAVRSRLDRARAIHEASEAAFDELKRQIATVLGHELRTPLIYVSGYTDLALENVAHLARDELYQFLQAIKYGADRLTQLIEEILTLVQLDTGQAAEDYRVVSEVRADLAAIIEGVTELHRQKATDNRVTLKMEVEPNLPPVRILEAFFANALGRLVDNGIKFSGASGKQVTVSAWAADGWVEVAVSDKGVGILPEEIPNLFQRFQKIDQERQVQQGLGLGLAIAQELIHLHGGDITVEGALGEGSTFVIRLPEAERG